MMQQPNTRNELLVKAVHSDRTYIVTMRTVQNTDEIESIYGNCIIKKCGILMKNKPDDEYDNGTPGLADQSPSLACRVSLLPQSMKEMQSNMQHLISQRLEDP